MVQLNEDLFMFALESQPSVQCQTELRKECALGLP